MGGIYPEYHVPSFLIVETVKTKNFIFCANRHSPLPGITTQPFAEPMIWIMVILGLPWIFCWTVTHLCTNPDHDCLTLSDRTETG